MSSPQINLVEVESALTTALETASGLGVYRGVAPPDATFPFVVFALLDGPERGTFGGGGHVELIYLIKVVDASPDGEAACNKADLINLALTSSSLAATGHTVFAVVRESVVGFVESVGDEIIQQAGGNYRLYVEKV